MKSGSVSGAVPINGFTYRVTSPPASWARQAVANSSAPTASGSQRDLHRKFRIILQSQFLLKFGFPYLVGVFQCFRASRPRLDQVNAFKEFARLGRGRVDPGPHAGSPRGSHGTVRVVQFDGGAG